jgi:hypothetical protein
MVRLRLRSFHTLIKIFCKLDEAGQGIDFLDAQAVPLLYCEQRHALEPDQRDPHPGDSNLRHSNYKLHPNSERASGKRRLIPPPKNLR